MDGKQQDFHISMNSNILMMETPGMRKLIYIFLFSNWDSSTHYCLIITRLWHLDMMCFGTEHLYFYFQKCFLRTPRWCAVWLLQSSDQVGNIVYLRLYCNFFLNFFVWFWINVTLKYCFKYDNKCNFKIILQYKVSLFQTGHNFFPIIFSSQSLLI